MANYGITSDDGGLWINNYKKAQGHPDKNGHIVITRDQMNMLAQHFRAGHTEVKVKLAAWDRTSKGDPCALPVCRRPRCLTSNRRSSSLSNRHRNRHRNRLRSSPSSRQHINRPSSSSIPGIS